MTNFLLLILIAFTITLQVIVASYLYFFGYRLSNKRYISAKYLTRIIVATTAWTVWQTLFYFYTPEGGEVWFYHLARTFFWISILIIPYWLVFFFLSFHNRRRDYSQYQFLRWPVYFVLFLVILPNYGLFTWVDEPPYRMGSLAFWLISIYVAIYIALSFIIWFFRYVRIPSKSIRAEMRNLGFAVLVSFFSIVLVRAFQNQVIFDGYNFVHSEPISVIILTSTILIMILQNKLYQMPIRVTNILYLILITFIIIYLRIFLVFQQGGSDILLDVGVLAAFVIFYSFLLWEIYTGIVQERELTSKYKLLEELIASKNDFLRSATHQLRTPLTVIIGYLSDLVDKKNNAYKMTEDAHQGLQKILISAKNLNTIINDLVATNDIKGGRFGINIHDKVEFQDLIQDILNDKKSILAERNIKIVFKKKKKDFEILVDKAKIREAFNNILDNAIFYGKDTIWIDISDTNSTMLEIRIRDNGIGIQPEEIKKIWKKFERGNRSPKVNPNGSGLGLYLAKMIMKKHGGDLVGDSEGEGKGSVFIFTIPKDTKALAPSESFGTKVKSRGGLAQL